MPEDGIIESHVPLLDQKQVKRLDELSNGLSLNKSSDQELFLARIDKVKIAVGADHVLEYLVNNRDIPIGSVDAAIKLQCNAARRIHWGAEQIRRHKQRNSHSVDAKVAKELTGAHA